MRVRRGRLTTIECLEQRHVLTVSFTPWELPSHEFSGGSDRSRESLLADFDGDGDLDAFVSSIGHDSIWLNDGNGRFTHHQNLLDSRSVYGDIGDVDNDGDVDIIIASENQHANALWLNDGSGTFVDSGQVLGNLEVWSQDVELADLNGDGYLDAYFANRWLETAKPAGDWVFFNDGHGNFTDSQQSIGAEASTGVDLGDIDSDGDIDAIVTALDRATLYWNNGDGTFATESPQRFLPGGNHPVAQDISADAELEIITAGAGPNPVWFHSGGVFDVAPRQLLGDSLSTHIAVADFDGDEDVDLFTSSWQGFGNRVWTNDAGQYTDSGISLDPELSIEHSDVGDVDGDGDIDVFAAVWDGPDHYVNIVYLNNLIDDPVAVDDEFRLVNEASLTGRDLLANDRRGFSVVVDSQPAHGVLVINDDGTFDYTPHASFHGLDEFSYRAISASGKASEPAVARIRSDDHGDSAGEASQPQDDPRRKSYYLGELESLTDVDWFEFEAFAGNLVHFDLAHMPVVDHDRWLSLRLYDSAGALLLDNSSDFFFIRADNGTFNSARGPALEWPTPADGVYFAEVRWADWLNEPVDDFDRLGITQVEEAIADANRTFDYALTISGTVLAHTPRVAVEIAPLHVDNPAWIQPDRNLQSPTQAFSGEIIFRLDISHPDQLDEIPITLSTHEANTIENLEICVAFQLSQCSDAALWKTAPPVGDSPNISIVLPAREGEDYFVRIHAKATSLCQSPRNGSFWKDLDTRPSTLLYASATLPDVSESVVSNVIQSMTTNYSECGGGSPAEGQITIQLIDNHFLSPFAQVFESVDADDASLLQWTASDNEPATDEFGFSLNSPYHGVVRIGFNFADDVTAFDPVPPALGTLTDRVTPDLDGYEWMRTFELDGYDSFNMLAIDLDAGQLLLIDSLAVAFDPHAGPTPNPCSANIVMGDFDENGSVEFADFLILSSNFGTISSIPSKGDADCDGRIQFSDFLTLSANFGRSV